MHQSFVVPAPLGLGIRGAFNFSVCKALLNALHRGDKFMKKFLLKAPDTRGYFLFPETVCSLLQKSNCIFFIVKDLGPVVQSLVSLTSSLRVISLTVLADSIHNILIFFTEKNVSSFCTAKATHIFSAKNIRIFAYHSM